MTKGESLLLIQRGRPPGKLSAVLGWALTFLCVMIAWVVFRADSVATAMQLYRGMLGLNGAPFATFAEFTGRSIVA